MDRTAAINTLCQILNPQSDLGEIVILLSTADWEALHSLAGDQGVALLLYDRLKGLTGLVPAEIQNKLRKSYLEATARNMVMLHHAGIILKAFRQQELALIPLKGLYLAEKVYASIGLRTFDDLDLLVHKDDLAEALQVMQGLGYQLSTWYDVNAPNTDIKHIPPLMKKGAPIVELHWRLLEDEAPFKIDMDMIWQRAVNAQIAETAVSALSLEDLILHLSLHFTYQHRLTGGLRGLYDIAEVIRRRDTEIDWQKLVKIGEKWGIQRVLWLTLMLLQEITQTVVPLDVLDRVKLGDSAREIVNEAKRQLIEQSNSEMFMTPDLAILTQTHGWWSKMKLIASRVFLPRRVMAREYNVDPRSPLIYWGYVRRFSRLIRQYRKPTLSVIAQADEANRAVDRELATAKLNQWLSGLD